MQQTRRAVDHSVSRKTRRTAAGWADWRALWGIGLCLAGWPAQAADICKWVDALGGVHYFDAPRVDQPCQAVIRVIHADPQELERSAERQKRLQTPVIPSSQKVPGPAANLQSLPEEDSAQKCRDATAELKFLEGAYGMRLVRSARDGENQAIDWIDDQEREALINDWRAQVQAWCRGVAPATDGPAPSRVFGAPVPRKR